MFLPACTAFIAAATVRIQRVLGEKRKGSTLYNGSLLLSLGIVCLKAIMPLFSSNLRRIRLCWHIRLFWSGTE